MLSGSYTLCSKLYKLQNNWWSRVCVCVCMCVCMHVCVHACVCTYVYVCVTMGGDQEESEVPCIGVASQQWGCIMHTYHAMQEVVLAPGSGLLIWVPAIVCGPSNLLGILLLGLNSKLVNRLLRIPTVSLSCMHARAHTHTHTQTHTLRLSDCPNPPWEVSTHPAKERKTDTDSS